MAYYAGEVPSGTIDSVNKIFTTAHSIQQIVFIIVDGAVYTGTTTISSATITLADAPTTSIFVFYYDTPTSTPSPSSIIVSQLKTMFTTMKGNLGGASDTEFLQWMNFISEYMYPKLYALNPNDYLQNRYIKTIANQQSYTLPSDFQTFQVGGIYKMHSGSTYQAINFDGMTMGFTAGETLTGATSGAIGTITNVTTYTTTGTIVMSGVSGVFADDELITSSGGGSATCNGTAYAFEHDNVRLSETGYGDDMIGYYMDSTYLYLTPVPDSEDAVYNFRYIPKLVEITSTSTYTIFTNADKEFLYYALETYWQQWRQDQGGEILAGQRYQQALSDFLRRNKKTPRVMRIPRRDYSYYQTNREIRNTNDLFTN